MKALIFDPVGGASGDMILAGLIHLGCPEKLVLETLEKLGLGKPEITLNYKKVNGISCLNLIFEVNEENHDRNWTEIKKMINKSSMDKSIKDIALNIFSALAVAEATVHGISADDVHFHEVGALDSIFDIVGIAAAIDYFKPEMICTTPLPLSSGTVMSRHGILPVPAPATLKLIEGLEVKNTGITGELVTPTGAAVIKSLVSETIPDELIINATGYGTGSKDFPGWPNLFRVMLCDVSSTKKELYVIEATIDDMIPEDFGSAFEQIRKAGAIDIYLIPCIMKDSRSGNIVQAIAEQNMIENVSSAILENTTSIGVRLYRVSRRILERREYQIDTDVGKIWIKEVITPSGAIRRKPEYRDMYRISGETGIPVIRIREIVNDSLKTNRDNKDNSGD